MSSARYTPEFKDEAVRQVVNHGHSVAEVAERLGVSTHSLYAGIKAVKPSKNEEQTQELNTAKKEILSLKAQLRRAKEERDILKKSRQVLCRQPRVKYPFIHEHCHQHSVRLLCRMLGVSRTSYYNWLQRPLSARAREDRPLLALIRDSCEASGRVYGSPRITLDLREMGEVVNKKRVARIMREHNIRAVYGYKIPKKIIDRPSIVSENRLQRQFTVDEPDQGWVTDITYIRTWQGWLYLAVVIDLYSRKVVGWSMRPTLARELVVDALLMAVWRRKPRRSVIIHSDQGSEYGSDDWLRCCQQHNLQLSMSRRGNCWDNAVAESFFSSLKKERVKKRIYRTHDLARADIFNYIEMFYNPKRRHSHLGGVSPEDFETASFVSNELSVKLG